MHFSANKNSVSCAICAPPREIRLQQKQRRIERPARLAVRPRRQTPLARDIAKKKGRQRRPLSLFNDLFLGPDSEFSERGTREREPEKKVVERERKHACRSGNAADHQVGILGVQQSGRSLLWLPHSSRRRSSCFLSGATKTHCFWDEREGKEKEQGEWIEGFDLFSFFILFCFFPLGPSWL